MLIQGCVLQLSCNFALAQLCVFRWSSNACLIYTQDSCLTFTAFRSPRNVEPAFVYGIISSEADKEHGSAGHNIRRSAVTAETTYTSGHVLL